MYQMPFDLFGEIPVTLDEIHLWVCALAPHYAVSQRALEHYVSAWHVVDKVRAAKAAGTFEHTITQAQARRSGWLARLGIRA